jgi:hypothetical protein
MIKKLTTIICLLVVPLFFIETPTLVLSEEIRYPIPCYEGKELEKVRQWEKTWVGKKIDSTNIDEVKELIPENYYNVLKNTEAWGDSWFEIVPYREYKMTTGTIEATKKYSPKCRIGKEKELIDWVAGVPFPEPKSGIEVAWNFYSRTRGDTNISYAEAYIIDGRRKYDRHAAFRVWSKFFAGRRDVPPTPELPSNPKKIHRGTFSHSMKPPEIKGMLIFQITYQDTLKTYDAWAWITAIRRIRRISMAQRTETDGGQDLCRDDNFGWDGAILRNEYKLLGRKEILVSRHQEKYPLLHTEGDCLGDGAQKERINVWVVEALNKDPGYIYKPNIWYIDPELWQIVYIDRYDKYGKLWKIYEEWQTLIKGYNGQDIPNFCGSSTTDVQRRHSTLGNSTQEMGMEIPNEIFTLKHMHKFGR